MPLRGELWAHNNGSAVDSAIIEMEANGFRIDVDYCNEQAKIARAHEEYHLVMLSSLLTVVGVVSSDPDKIWSSPPQLIKLLHDDLGYPPSPVWKKGRVKIDEGQRKTDEVALMWIRSRVDEQGKRLIDEIIQLRRVRGSIKYLQKLPTFVAPDGFVHPVCGPAGDGDDRVGAITGRLAGKNPEFMQIPSNPEKDIYQIRKAFIAPENHTLICADYSALEVVIMAHMLKVIFRDNQLAEMVDPNAPDIHAVNARKTFSQLGWKVRGVPVGDYIIEDFKSDPDLKRLRQMVKEISYGLAYGKTAYGFATSLRGPDGEPVGEDKAQEIVDAYLDSIPGIRKFHSWVWEFIRRYKGIPDIGGRWCDLRELVEGKQWQQRRALRIAQNFPMQGGGAWIVGKAMVACSNDTHLRDCGLRLERQIHDELNWRVPTENVDKVLGRINEHMTANLLTVPLQVTIKTGANWHVCK